MKEDSSSSEAEEEEEEEDDEKEKEDNSSEEEEEIEPFPEERRTFFSSCTNLWRTEVHLLTNDLYLDIEI